MTIQAFLNDFALKFSHTYSNTEMINWINQIDNKVYTDTKESFNVAYYKKILNETSILLPTGVEFEDISSLQVNGIPYQASTSNVSRYDRGRFYFYENGRLEIRPIQDGTDITYTSDANEITFRTNTITTTGDDFVGICIGDTVTITGALLNTANNKTAIVVDVDLKVLTFPASTFTAQAEAAAITLTVPTIRLVYKAKPTEKTIADIATELMIPRKFQEIYEYYLMFKISLVRKEFNDANNYSVLFNNMVDAYEKDYQSKKGIKPAFDCIIDEGWSMYETSDFDKGY